MAGRPTADEAELPGASRDSGDRTLVETLFRQRIEPDLILNVLASVVMVVDDSNTIVYANNAAELLFQSSASTLRTLRLDQILPPDSPLLALVGQVRNGSGSVVEYQLSLTSPRIGNHLVNVQVAPVQELDHVIIVSMQELSLAAKIDRQLTHRGAARSVGAMAAMLAHEVKNPLAGIRGAAQLLEQSVRPEDRPLTTLIRDEADRVCSLVDRMDAFSERGPLRREAVNIHEVLLRVRALVENGFGGHLRFVELFDPSLPPVHGDRDQLIQVFLNLVKNAAEAAPADGGEIVLATAYCHGIRLAVAASQAGRTHLPLMVSIQDNGEGIPDELKPNLFEPFVTSKPRGSGLGLALVAKIVGDHGGIIEFDSVPKRTVFRVMLPMHLDSED